MAWNFESSATSTDYSFTGTDGNTWAANNNAWAPTAGPQTIYVNSNNDWQVVSTQTYDTEYYVESYPYIRWAGSDPLSSYTRIIGTTSETNPGYASAMQWEAAWQIYLASTPGADNGWAFMVWTDVSGVSPGGSSTPVTISGVSYDWYDPGTYDGNHVLIRTANTPSDCVTDILACLTWAVENAENPPTGGMAAALSTIEFGFEIWGTGGTAQTFTCTGCTLEFNGPGSPSVTTTSLPAAAEGQPYSATLAAAGGVTPYAWSISSGSLPSWASLDSATGVISGTPPGVGGSTTFTAEVTDSDHDTATQALTLSVASSPQATAAGSFRAATAAHATVIRAGHADLPVAASPAAAAAVLPPGGAGITAAAAVAAAITAGAEVISAPKTVTPPPPPPASAVLTPSQSAGVPATTYTYAATDLITGELLADSIPLNVQSFSMQLNGGGTLTASLDLDELPQVNAPFTAALAARRAVIWVLAGGWPAWCGVVWDWPDMSRQDGTLPVSAQTIDTVWSHRLITDTIEYPATDLFAAFTDLVTYGMTKQSSYISSVSPPATRAAGYLAMVAASGGVAGLVLPSGAAAVAGVPWTASYTYSDLTQVSSAWQDMAASGNLVYAFVPGLTPDGQLAIYLQLGYDEPGVPLPSTGLVLTYPGNCLDYGWQVSGSQSGNYVWATAPPNGSQLQWQSEWPHGADLTDLASGYPLMESTVSWQGSVVTAQSQVDSFADGQVSLLTGGMITPTVNVGGGAYPSLQDIVLGDSVWFAATSPLHPPVVDADGFLRPGLTRQLRITGWTAYPPGPQQSEYVQISTSAVAASS